MLIKLTLELGNVNVEAENLCREGVLSGEVLGATNALLPGSACHGAIMGLVFAASNCEPSALSIAGTGSRH